MKQQVASEDSIDNLNFVPGENSKDHIVSCNESPVSNNIISKVVFLDPHKSKRDRTNSGGASNIENPTQKEKEYEFNFVKAFEIAKQKNVEEQEDLLNANANANAITFPQIKYEKKKFMGRNISSKNNNNSPNQEKEIGMARNLSNDDFKKRRPESSLKPQDDLTSSRAMKGHDSTARSLSRPPFETLKIKLEGGFLQFLQKHRYSAILTGSKKYEGKTGNFYLTMKKLEEKKSIDKLQGIDTSPKFEVSGSPINTNKERFPNEETITLTPHMDNDMIMAEEGYTRPNAPLAGIQNNSVGVKKQTVQGRTKQKVRVDRKREQDQKSKVHERGRVKGKKQDVNIKLESKDRNNKIFENTPEYKSIRNIIGVTSHCNDLTPIPSKKSKVSTFPDVEYTQAERAAVLIRRIEYSYNMKNQKNNIDKEAEMMYFNLLVEAKAVIIQRWWRRCMIRLFYQELKACEIQKVFRGYLTRIMVKTSLRQMNDIYPFLSSVFYAIEKRMIINSFRVMCKHFAKKAQQRIWIKNIMIIQKAYRRLLERVRFKKKKLGRMIALLCKPQCKKAFATIKGHYKRIDKVTKIQSAFLGINYRSNPKLVLAVGREVHPFLYYFLTYNNPRKKNRNGKENNAYYLKINRFLQIAHRFKFVGLRKKFTKLFNVTKKSVIHAAYRKHFVYFTRRLFNYRVIQLRIKLIAKTIKSLLPLIKTNSIRRRFNKWKLNYWKCKNYCRLGINLYGKYLKFCYWKKLKKLLKNINETLVKENKLRRLLKYKEKNIKLQILLKMKRYVKLGNLRERKIMKFIIKKDVMAKKRIMEKLGNIVFYKNKFFTNSYRLSIGYEMLKKISLKKIINSIPFPQIKKLFLIARIKSRMKNIFILSKRCDVDKFHHIFIEWGNRAISRKKISNAQLGKLKKCFITHQKKIAQIMKKKLNDYHISIARLILAEKYKTNQSNYLKSFSFGSLMISNYSNSVYEPKAINFLIKGAHRISLRLFLIELIEKVNKHMSRLKSTAFFYISNFARIKYMRRILLKKLLTGKQIGRHERLFKSFQILKKETFGEYISNQRPKYLNDEEKEKGKMSLVSKFLINKTKKIENVINYFYQKWKESAKKEKVLTSSKIISLHSRKVLNKIRQKKAFNINNETQMSKQWRLGNFLNKKIDKYGNRLEVYFNQWRKSARKIKSIILAGVIMRYCRKIQRKMYLAKFRRIFGIPFLRRLLKREFLLFAKKKINTTRACKALNKFYLSMLKSVISKISFKAYLVLMDTLPSPLQIKEIKDAKFKFFIASKIRKREAIVFTKFHHWRNLITMSQIFLSAMKICRHVRKGMGLRKLRRSSHLLQIRNLLRIGTRVNKFRKFKLIFKRLIYNIAIKPPYTKIKNQARSRLLARIIKYTTKQKVKISLIRWKLMSRLINHKCKVIQSCYRKFIECGKKEIIQLKKIIMTALMKNLIADKEKIKKFYFTKFKRMTNVFIMRTKIKGNQVMFKTKNRQVYKDKKIGMLKYLFHTFDKNHLPQDVDFKRMANRFKFWKNLKKFIKLKYALSNINKGFGAVIYFHKVHMILNIYFIKWRKFSKLSSINQKMILVQRTWRSFRNSRRERKELVKKLTAKRNLSLEKCIKLESILSKVCFRRIKKKFMLNLAKVKPLTKEEKENILQKKKEKLRMMNAAIIKITRTMRAFKKHMKKVFLLKKFFKKKEKVMTISLYKAFIHIAWTNKKTKLLYLIPVIQRFIKDRLRSSRRLKIFTAQMKMKRIFKKHLIHKLASMITHSSVKARQDKIQKKK